MRLGKIKPSLIFILNIAKVTSFERQILNMNIIEKKVA